MPAFMVVVKESKEKGSLSEDLVRAHARSVSCISYFCRSAEGWIQPEVQYPYDLVIPLGADPAAFEPKPLDGEVESFDLRFPSAWTSLSSILSLIDLFIRLDITPDNVLQDRDYAPHVV
ncbi:hypothetical protein FB451DRAFT_1395650 [Mycena latifolia]|nr:hypothetical protein FB451DRAFT_1395650 [Mycena latifolia]